MAVSRKIERELLREKFLSDISEYLYEKGEEVLRVKSNEVAIPVVGCEGNEDFIVITVKVPTGANKGSEKKKAEKIAKDKAIREKKKEISEKGE